MSTTIAVTTNLDALTTAHDAWVRAIGDAAEALDNCVSGGLGDRLRDASMKYEEAVAAALGETKQDLAVSVLRELLDWIAKQSVAASEAVATRLSEVCADDDAVLAALESSHLRRRRPIEQAIGELEAWKEDAE